MKIYRISQDLNGGCDTYDSAVVYAENEEEARTIYPDDSIHYIDGKWYSIGTTWGGTEYKNEDTGYTWVESKDINKIKVEYLGEADLSIKKGVILSSFNAG
jgi:hypothetical protein